MKLQVLSSETRSGVSKAQRPYSFQLLKCVVTADDGSLDVGEVTLFDFEGEVKPGVYEPLFTVRRSHEGRLEGQISGLRPYIAGPKAA